MLIAEDAGELGGLAQHQRIGGDERQHDGIQVLSPPPEAEQERDHHHDQLHSMMNSLLATHGDQRGQAKRVDGVACATITCRCADRLCKNSLASH